MKIQSLDKLHDPSSGLLTDAWDSVDHPGHRAFGDMGHFRHVLDCHGFVLTLSQNRFLLNGILDICKNFTLHPLTKPF
jgi:hypothetical protein